METGPAASLVAAALAGDEPALRGLVDRLTPVIQARVARALLAGRGPDGRPLRPQVEDLTQEVFLLLFADGGRVLRSWRPEQGLSLDNFVGLVARRRALSWLRSGHHSAWREDPTLDEAAAAAPAAAEDDPEGVTASREEVRLLLRRLQEELSPLGWRLFELLLVRERPVAEVERATGMSRDALYAWRSRLRRLARRLLAEIAGPAVRSRPDAANLSGGR
jgi:RNA polymerase sigma-70 factor (ECF subfamily)